MKPPYRSRYAVNHPIHFDPDDIPEEPAMPDKVPGPPIVIYFWVGERNRARCRLVLGHAVEVLSEDALGTAQWVKAAGVGTANPSAESLIERALRQVLVIPESRTLTDSGRIEIEL